MRKLFGLLQFALVALSAVVTHCHMTTFVSWVKSQLFFISFLFDFLSRTTLSFYQPSRTSASISLVFRVCLCDIVLSVCPSRIHTHLKMVVFPLVLPLSMLFFGFVSCFCLESSEAKTRLIKGTVSMGLNWRRRCNLLIM